MASHSINSSGKIGSSGGYYARWIREMGDQKQRLFKGKTPGRELLVVLRVRGPGRHDPDQVVIAGARDREVHLERPRARGGSEDLLGIGHLLPPELDRGPC